MGMLWNGTERVNFEITSDPGNAIMVNYWDL